MNTTQFRKYPTVTERDAIVTDIIKTLKKKHNANTTSAHAIFIGMATVLLNDEQLELLLTVSQKEKN